MYKGRNTRIVPIILVILIVAIVIAALVSLGRALFFGGSQQPATDPAVTALHDTSGVASVEMLVRGPIVANENFRSYRITVSPSSRTLTTYKGYVGQVANSQQYDNNQQAYEQFVYALDKANMVKGTALTGEKDDTRGVCATGKVYEFSVLQGDSAVKHLWTSTCSGSHGSFNASVSQVGNLFLKQLPDGGQSLDSFNLTF